MTNTQSSDKKFSPEHQLIYQQTHKTYATDGYELDWIDEVYLPFWECTQSIYVQTKVQPEQLSIILFTLINIGYKSKKDICTFLGISEDDFILRQLDFLIDQAYIEENLAGSNLALPDDVYYEITQEGHKYFANTSDDTHIDREEIKYVLSELDIINGDPYEVYLSRFTQLFTNTLSANTSNSITKFSGYKAVQTRNLASRRTPPEIIIPHKKKA